MPHCNDSRWHATQEEADACTKHPADKDFENLSTESRLRRRRKVASRTLTPPSTPSMSDAGSIAAPTMDRQSNHTEDYADDEQDDDVPHTPTAQDETVPTGQPVAEWLKGVSSHPDSVPHTHLTDPRTGLLHTPITPGTKTCYGESEQDRHDEQELHDATIRRIAATLGQAVRAEKGSPEGDSDNHLNMEDPAKNRRPWYADGDVQAIFRALLWAVLCGLPLFGLVFFLADQDAARFP